MTKVLFLNGSPHKGGCTVRAMREVETALVEAGSSYGLTIETEFVNVNQGNAIESCRACSACRTLKRCIVVTDDVNAFTKKAEEADGFIFGSAVHYASATGGITSYLDRAFFSNSKAFAFKPGAAVVSARRTGTIGAFDQLNKYFTISNMLIVGSQYWNEVHGSTPNQVEEDLEGMQTMRVLGRNMAWTLKCLDLAKQEGIKHPELEKPRTFTNFIR